MATTILFIGLMVFFAHFLSLQFRKTGVPDVLVLMLVGVLLGPVLGLVTAEDFGKAGSLIATIALVVILFESGTSQYGVGGGGTIRGVTYMVVLASIAFTPLLVMAYPSRVAQRIYSRALRKPTGVPHP